jgi:flagellar hook-associated protein 3 FlgL
MATNRVASFSSMTRVQADLAHGNRRLVDIFNEVSSTKRLRKPSDGPPQVSTALHERAVLRRNEQYATNATDASGWLKLSDHTLMLVQENLAVAKERAIFAVNGSLGAESLASLAYDLRGIRTTIIMLANTTYQGRAVFGGTVPSSTPAYSAAGEYTGDDGVVRRGIADGVNLRINITGLDAFGVASATTPLEGDLFQILEELAAAVEAGDTAAIRAGHAAMEAATTRVATAQTRIGGLSEQVEQTLAHNAVVQIDVKERLTQVEDTDLAEAIVRLNAQQAAYQAALGVTARVIQPSLLDFLR